jgi:hypothetical protein
MQEPGEGEGKEVARMEKKEPKEIRNDVLRFRGPGTWFGA